MSKPLVSIYVPVFQHEEFAVQALDSILMQKVNFPFEVFVGEDCSRDNTRQILQQWQQAHPDPRFTFLYREQNMHRLPINNATDLRQRCKGKYLICLEGDDFWTDPDKLQTQVDFLESHPQYLAVAHNCTVVGRDSLPNAEQYPECKDEEYTFRHFASDILPGQYTTLLARNYLLDPEVDKHLLSLRLGPGDRRAYFTLLCHGRIHCIQKAMSAYRHITDSGNSFSATNRYSFERLEAEAAAYMEYAHRLQHPQAIAVAEFLYLRTIRYAWRHRHIQAACARQYVKKLRHPLRTYLLLCKRDINYRIFHKTLHI